MANENTSSMVEFERDMKELEDLVSRMESGELSLEESLQCFERGVALTRACQQALQQAEQKVQMLLERDGRQEIVDAPRED